MMTPSLCFKAQMALSRTISRVAFPPATSRGCVIRYVRTGASRAMYVRNLTLACTQPSKCGCSPCEKAISDYLQCANFCTSTCDSCRSKNVVCQNKKQCCKNLTCQQRKCKSCSKKGRKCKRNKSCCSGKCKRKKCK